MEPIMKNMTIEKIIEICNGEFFGNDCIKSMTISSISTDSRKIEKNNLFIAIVGKRADGHDFISSVYEKGAICCISEKILEDPKGAYIKVESSLEAIRRLAICYRMQFHIPIIGITGSVGKTSAKEMIASVLSQKFGKENVLKTDGNFNNELGVPFTIFRLRNHHKIAVLEMGISDFGEMHRLSEIAKPDVAVITNIAQCHLENLGDRTGVLKAKTEIFDFLPEDGNIVLNGDDDKLFTIKNINHCSIIFFGKSSNYPIYADNIKANGLESSSCTIHIGNDIICVTIPVPGTHMVSSALAAAAVGKIFNIKIEQIKTGIEEFQPVGHRLHIIKRNGKTIIDDCYNASLMSMKAAIDILENGTGRRVAILGDMGELGVKEREFHKEVGKYCANAKIEVLLCAGTLGRFIVEAAALENKKLEIHYFEDKKQLLEALPQLLNTGDSILVKASRFMGYEEIVAKIK